QVFAFVLSQDALSKWFVANRQVNVIKPDSKTCCAKRPTISAADFILHFCICAALTLRRKASAQKNRAPGRGSGRPQGHQTLFATTFALPRCCGSNSQSPRGGAATCRGSAPAG